MHFGAGQSFELGHAPYCRKTEAGSELIRGSFPVFRLRLWLRRDRRVQDLVSGAAQYEDRVRLLSASWQFV